MRVIVGAVMAALGTTCAQAQPAIQPNNFVNVAFNIGQKFGMAEVLVGGCELAVVDPKVREGVMTTLPQNYMDAFSKGFGQGWRKAVEAVSKMTIPATADQKRCLLALELYGPKGSVVKNLIIPLGGDNKR